MGILDKLKKRARTVGLIDDQPDPELVDQERQEQMERTWHWIRTQIDTGCEQYLHTGNDETLRNCLADGALVAVLERLDVYRQNQIVWSFPADKRNTFDLRINNQFDDTWIVTEHFSDFSRVEQFQNGQSVRVEQGSGERRALKATIVGQGNSFYVTELVPVI